MNLSRPKKIIYSGFVIGLALGVVVFWRFDRLTVETEKNLPAPVDYQARPQSPPPEADGGPPPAAALPAEINLDIPFTAQAPFKVWDEEHEDFCEEATLVMAASYLSGHTIPSPEYVDAEMYKIKVFEEQRFGYWKSTTAEETAVILKEYYGLKNIAVVYDPKLADIKQALARGQAVIVPAAGRQLGNPNFTGAGPLYHMLVIKGYTKEGQVITNDPGTRKGADYIYDIEVIMNAIHDWNGGEVNMGRAVAIVAG